MSDLFTDLVDGDGRDYFFSLESAPGGLTPAKATLTVQGHAPSIFEQTTVFRSPAPAVLTINGLAFAPEFAVSPAVGVLTLNGQVPDEYREKIITLPMPEPSYDIQEALIPTILFINTITPQTGLIQLSSLTLNVTAGGDIGFVSPGVGALNLAYGPVTLITNFVEVGQLSLVGHAPTLLTEMTLGTDEDAFEPGSLTIIGLAPTLQVPFGWIDVDPQPPTTWTTTTGIAA